MPETHQLALFVAAALLLAVTPGPGILYVLTRTLAGGRREGVLSSLGTFAGGLVHVGAAAVGLSAVLATSATAFLIVKYAGACYLVYLGIQMIRTREADVLIIHGRPTESAFLQGVATEVLNPKTALFFLSFIPQFVDVHAGNVIGQFLALGTISVIFNTMADLVVAWLAGPIGTALKKSARMRRMQRGATGTAMIGLGAYVALADTH